MARAAEVLAMITGAEPATSPPDRVSLPIASGSIGLAEVVRLLDGAGVTAADVGLRRPTLDEVFLRLTDSQPERQVA